MTYSYIIAESQQNCKCFLKKTYRGVFSEKIKKSVKPIPFLQILCYNKNDTDFTIKTGGTY